MKNYNDVLRNPDNYILTDIEKRYIELYSVDNNNSKRERLERENFRQDCIKHYKRCIISNVFQENVMHVI